MFELVMQLKLVTSQTDEPEEETSLTGLAGGCCFDFNKVSEHLCKLMLVCCLVVVVIGLVGHVELLY